MQVSLECAMGALESALLLKEASWPRGQQRINVQVVAAAVNSTATAAVDEYYNYNYYEYNNAKRK